MGGTDEGARRVPGGGSGRCALLFVKELALTASLSPIPHQLPPVAKPLQAGRRAL